ncbi:hypothetical protein FRC09_007119, partial [Ceratobasidium sp. 395]
MTPYLLGHPTYAPATFQSGQLSPGGTTNAGDVWVNTHPNCSDDENGPGGTGGAIPTGAGGEVPEGRGESGSSGR